MKNAPPIIALAALVVGAALGNAAAAAILFAVTAVSAMFGMAYLVNAVVDMVRREM